MMAKPRKPGWLAMKIFINVSRMEPEETDPLENSMVNDFQRKPNNGKCS
jgi:hypothetical protein